MAINSASVSLDSFTIGVGIGCDENLIFMAHRYIQIQKWGKINMRTGSFIFPRPIAEPKDKRAAKEAGYHGADENYAECHGVCFSFSMCSSASRAAILRCSMVGSLAPHKMAIRVS